MIIIPVTKEGNIESIFSLRVTVASGHSIHQRLETLKFLHSDAQARLCFSKQVAIVNKGPRAEDQHPRGVRVWGAGSLL